MKLYLERGAFLDFNIFIDEVKKIGFLIAWFM